MTKRCFVTPFTALQFKDSDDEFNYEAGLFQTARFYMDSRFFSKLQELPEDPELLEQDDEERVDCSPTFFPDLPCQEQLDDINRLLAETKQAADGQARGHALTG